MSNRPSTQQKRSVALPPPHRNDGDRATVARSPLAEWRLPADRDTRCARGTPPPIPVAAPQPPRRADGGRAAGGFSETLWFKAGAKLDEREDSTAADIATLMRRYAALEAPSAPDQRDYGLQASGPRQGADVTGTYTDEEIDAFIVREDRTPRKRLIVLGAAAGIVGSGLFVVALAHSSESAQVSPHTRPVAPRLALPRAQPQVRAAVTPTPTATAAASNGGVAAIVAAPAVEPTGARSAAPTVVHDRARRVERKRTARDSDRRRPHATRRARSSRARADRRRHAKRVTHAKKHRRSAKRSKRQSRARAAGRTRSASGHRKHRRVRATRRVRARRRAAR